MYRPDPTRGTLQAHQPSLSIAPSLTTACSLIGCLRRVANLDCPVPFRTDHHKGNWVRMVVDASARRIFLRDIKLATSCRRRLAGRLKILVVGCFAAWAPALFAEEEHLIPLMMSGSNLEQEGFARIINHSDDAGTVSILAIDDSGDEYGPVELSIGAKSTVNFNSGDLEQGNHAKGLSNGVGSGEGNWRLLLRTILQIEPMAYVRTMDGFVTNVQTLSRGTASRGVTDGYHVPTFNPGSNRNQQSSLRLINTSGSRTEISITGLDDRGASPAGGVTLTLGARESRVVSAWDLETGGTGLSGSLGDGSGKWQLFVKAPPSVLAMSLLNSPTGHLANISRGGSVGVLELDAGSYFRDRVDGEDCPHCPLMVVIPPGTFTMGSNPGEGRETAEEGRDGDEGPLRDVTIEYAFAVGVYEVTFDEWDACAHDGDACDNHFPEDEGWGFGRRPVMGVSYWDAQRYVEWLSDQTGENYRLLTEAEWEYAARAGTTTPFHFGETINSDQANYDATRTYGEGERGLYRGQTLEVGSFPPNRFGLHDVHGNVWEWVEDCYVRSYVSAPTDGSQMDVDCRAPRYYVIRGGSWRSRPSSLRSAERFPGAAANRTVPDAYGFRVARSLP